MIGFWATLSLNMPDFTRFGRSQREQMRRPGRRAADDDVGLRGDGRPDHERDRDHLRPRDLGPGPARRPSSRAPVVVAISMFTAVVATLAVNIAANVVSPANDFANAFPRLIRFKTGGLITGHPRHPDAAVEAARRPVRLHLHVAARVLGRARARSPACSSPTTGSCAGRSSRSEDLYLPDGAYRYAAGWNWKAVVATLVGCALAWGGLVVPAVEAALLLRLVRRLLRRGTSLLGALGDRSAGAASHRSGFRRFLIPRSSNGFSSSGTNQRRERRL